MAVRKLRTRDARPKTGRDQPRSGKTQADPPAIPEPPVLTDEALEAAGAAVGVGAGFDYLAEGAGWLAGNLAQMAHESINSTAGRRFGRTCISPGTLRGRVSNISRPHRRQKT